MKKQKLYTVYWSERKCIALTARSKEDAREKVLNCQYEEDQVSAELDSNVEAYEVNE